MTIRVAELTDIEQLQLLYQKQLKTQQVYQPYYFKADLPAVDFLEETIKSDQAEFIVVEHEGQLIGMAALFIEETLPYECYVSHRYLNFADLYVEEGFRNKGLGKELIENVKKWGKEKKVDYIELLVLRENSKAQALYLKESFETVHSVMRYKL
ncbi:MULTISPECIES: GNAT family N-acetyltransferase [Myroides]|uniref:GNAT family N-acetyltransferase n=1 Tax=Myroides albus TaxID=2562892 RepID=A0A6I3LS98_9FLAO|nr:MULTISPECIES: GNAT family N-acetyltransferase [Myroides]MTG98865.1 GNAT family N-acetyltransferase [Myroides albus]MVX37121.1 GNAT family N-acetyltransferase [Myroides sp. LoEW2-1]UVD79577.1 GNAT family N-acetyltransferase [Myroides albus]